MRHIVLIWGNERLSSPPISYLRQEPPPRGALNNNHSVLSVRTSTSSVHSTPQTPEQIASFLRYSLAPRRGVLYRVTLFTQRNASSPVDTTHVYEDPSDAPNTLPKALFDRLIDFVFSHRRFARPRGCTTISGWYVTQILTGPHRREGLHFVFPFAQRITSSPVDTTLVYEDPSDAPNTSSKAPLARLVVFVFSHRRSTRPRGAPRAAQRRSLPQINI